MGHQNEIINIKKLTKEMRKNILKMSLAAGSGSSHFGGSLSTVELLATLYNSVLKFDSSNPLWIPQAIALPTSGTPARAGDGGGAAAAAGHRAGLENR